MTDSRQHKKANVSVIELLAHASVVIGGWLLGSAIGKQMVVMFALTHIERVMSDQQQR